MKEKKSLTVPILETERLTLASLTKAHSEGMFELWSSKKVCEYCPKAPDTQGNPIQLPVRSRTDSDRMLDWTLHFQRKSLGFRWGMIEKKSSEFVGAMGFNSLGNCSEIAYHLIPRFWGLGYMNESCCVAIEWVKKEYGCKKIDAFMEAENASSIRLIQRLGFILAEASREGADRYLLSMDEFEL